MTEVTPTIAVEDPILFTLKRSVELMDHGKAWIQGDLWKTVDGSWMGQPVAFCSIGAMKIAAREIAPTWAVDYDKYDDIVSGSQIELRESSRKIRNMGIAHWNDEAKSYDTIEKGFTEAIKNREKKLKKEAKNVGQEKTRSFFRRSQESIHSTSE